MKKVAVIGFGFMGMAHCIHILKNENLELVSIIEKDVHSVPGKLSSKSGNLSTGNVDVNVLSEIPVYPSLASCLEKEKLDAVHVCVHTDLHYQIAKEALNFGLHVIVEKPFCLDVTQGAELINIAREKGLVLMVAHVVRFMSPYQKLVEFINSRIYGELDFLSLSRFTGMPMWGQWKEKQKQFGVSGGALFDLVIHDIDFALFALGEFPEKVESTVLPGKLSNHDYVNAIWHFQSKKTIVKIEGGNFYPANYPFQAGFTAVFEKATVSFSTNNPKNIFIDDDNSRIEIAVNDLDEGYYNEIELFSKSMEKGQVPEKYSPESALETIRLCHLHN